VTEASRANRSWLTRLCAKTCPSFDQLL